MSTVIDKADYLDRIKGMLLFGAYGDALGAPHELDGLQGNVIDPQLIRKLALGSSFYEETTMNQWSVWPPPDMVCDCCGIPTDDTAYRLTIFHPWLKYCLENNSGLTEAGFREWMEKAGSQDRSHPDWYLDCRDAQVAQWLEMFDAADKHEEAVFFLPDLPVVFGLFLYLELGAIFPGRPLTLTFQIFRHLTRLDQSYAGIITALCAILLAKSISHQVEKSGFGDWYINSANDVLDELEPYLNTRETGDFYQRLRKVTHDMETLGKNQRHNSEMAFVEALKREVYDHSDWFNPRLKNFDPLLFWMQMGAAAAYAPEDPVKVIRVLAASAGDADTVPTMMGTIAGAWLGMSALRELQSGDINIAEELGEIESVLETFFGTDMDAESKLFWDLYQVQSGGVVA